MQTTPCFGGPLYFRTHAFALQLLQSFPVRLPQAATSLVIISLFIILQLIYVFFPGLL